MAIKYSTSSGSGGGTGFNVQIGSQYSYAAFSSPLSAGAYTIKSAQTKTNFDVYLLDANNNLVAYTNTASITPLSAFAAIVVVNGTPGDILQFSYQTTVFTTAETTYFNAAPFITSATPTSLPNQNSTIAVSGGNFSTLVAATFTGTDLVARTAKSVVRSSATSLIITRPDVFPPSASPYTLSLTNPGINSPTASNANIFTGITAGSLPIWNTSTTLPQFSQNVPYSVTLSATDSNPGGSITYSYVSGSLPSGVSFNSGTGVISGTPTVATPGVYTYTVGATSGGGNTVTRTFTMQDTGPVWVTSGSLTSVFSGNSYSYQLVANDDSGVAPTYSLATGSLPTGLSLSSSGLISGTFSGGSGTSTFTVTATDANGTSITSGSLSIQGLALYNQVYTSNSTFTTPSTAFYSTNGTANALEVFVQAGGGGTSGPYDGGAGAGGAVYAAALSVSSNTGYGVTVGGGASSYSNGGNSVFNSMTAYGGGYGGGNSSQNGNSGGCGGGARASSGNSPGSGSTQTSNGGGTGYGNAGGTGGSGGPYQGGGGGGIGGAGSTGLPQGNGYGGVGLTFFGNGYGGGGGGWNAYQTYGGSGAQGLGGGGNSSYGGGNGGGGGNNNNNAYASTAGTNGKGGGAGGDGASAQSGGSGVVIVRYYA